MRHMRPLHKKAARIDNYVVSRKDDDVVALQSPPAPQRPHVPMACSLMFTPGWEVDAPAALRDFANQWSAIFTTAL